MDLNFKICVDDVTGEIHLIISGVPDKDINDLAMSFIGDLDRRITQYVAERGDTK